MRQYLFEFMTAVGDASVVIYFHAPVYESLKGDIRAYLRNINCFVQASGVRYAMQKV